MYILYYLFETPMCMCMPSDTYVCIENSGSEKRVTWQKACNQKQPLFNVIKCLYIYVFKVHFSLLVCVVVSETAI
jgi:hypothetical protein